MHARQHQTANSLLADLQPAELTSLATAIDRVLARVREIGANRAGQ
jgi:hypothetical protein